MGIGWIILGSVCGLLLLAVVGFVIFAVVWDKKHRKYVMANGQPAVAWIVQANTALYEEGHADYPAMVLISPDDTADEEFMEELAQRVAELKGEKPKDKTEREVADLVNDETYRARQKDKLPKKFTDGKEVYSTGLMIERHLLPEKVLDRPYVHCQVVWDDPRSCLYMLPYPKKKRKTWKDDEE